MKIDARVKILNPKSECLAAGEVITIPVDEDYCSDFDDVIQDIETTLWDKYGVSMANTIDFEIENAAELCEELSGTED